MKLSDFETIALSDGKELNADENIHATLIGMAVDYLTRIELGEEKESAFHVSLRGATLAEGFGMTNASDTAQKLLKGIKGLDKKSITNACKLSSFDVWVRNFMGALMAKTYKEINPDDETIENIQILVSRTVSFFEEYGPVVKRGFTFEPISVNENEYQKMKETGEGSFGGYTPTITTGDGDILTKDSLWEVKVLSSKPKTQHTLQLLVYWIMGQHSGQECFKPINKLGIFNPRMNMVYLLDTSKISKETVKVIEKEVICYPV